MPPNFRSVVDAATAPSSSISTVSIARATRSLLCEGGTLAREPREARRGCSERRVGGGAKRRRFRLTSCPGQRAWGDGGPPSSAGEFAGRLWQIAREAGARKRQVVDAVRLVQEAKGRDELRIDVEAELAGQRMPQDPIWVERTLDELEQSPADQVRKKAKDHWCRHRRGRRRATHAQPYGCSRNYRRRPPMFKV